MKNSIKLFISALIIIQFLNCSLQINKCQAQWVMQPVPESSGLLLSIDFIDSSKLVSCGWNNFNGKAIYTTNGGTNWLSALVPNLSRSFVTVDMVNSMTGYMAGASNLSFDTKHNNISNSILEKSDYTSSMIKYRNNIGLNSGSDYKGLFAKTNDGGRNWFAQSNLAPYISYLIGMDFIDENTGVITSSNNDALPTRNASILKTTNSGVNWIEVLNSDSVKELRSIEYIDDNTIIAVGYGGTVDSIVNNSGGMIFKSTDGGINWSLQFFPGLELTSISFANLTTGFVTANDAGHGYVYRTTDQGNSWDIVVTILGNVLIYGVDFHKVSSTGMICGILEIPTLPVGFAGFTMRTTNLGNTWGAIQLLDTTGNNVIIGGVMISDSNQYISGGNPFSQGLIFHTTNGGLVSISNSDNSIPEKFSLSQNYPNPFNPTTNLEFGISELGFVSLKIYDVNGREIQTLVNEKLAPGTYKYQFSTINSQLPSGVYFYRLTAGEFTETKSMILLK